MVEGTELKAKQPNISLQQHLFSVANSAAVKPPWAGPIASVQSALSLEQQGGAGLVSKTHSGWRILHPY